MVMCSHNGGWRDQRPTCCMLCSYELQGMSAGVRMALPPEVERNVEGFAASIESLVDKFVSGELGGELVENMDKFMTGFISSFERRYQRLEKVIKSTIGGKLMQSPKRKRGAKALQGAGKQGEEKEAAAAAATAEVEEPRRRTKRLRKTVAAA